jgi:DNA-binding response OmpR family regulator
MSKTSNVVLVLEDEPLIAMAIEAVVEQASLVPRTSRGLADALALGSSIDLRGAVLDYWIGSEDTTKLAELLRARATPFILLTGGNPPLAGGPFSGIPVLRKPYSDQELLERIQDFGVCG